MIGAILFSIAAVVLALELISLGPAAKRVRVDCETDLSMAEPDEIITLRYTVSNLSSLPKLFLGVSIYFGENAVIREDADWMEIYADKNAAGVSFQRHFALLPHTAATGKVRFSLTKRGLHTIGKVYMETGDFLGLHTSVISEEAKLKIICTARMTEEEPETQTLGGLLGEISVRRFIHEDPTMIMGFRPYTGREPMRQISWPATARAGQLMVKELDYTVDTNVAVVVNMQDPRRRWMERCLELVRTVCETLEDRKIPYALVSNGDLGSLEEGLGKGHIFAVLRGLGLSRLAAYESFLPLAERCVTDRRTNRSYIVITPEPDSEGVLQLLQQHSDCELCVLYGNGGAT